MLPKHRPPTHPGELLNDIITEMGMTQGELAKKLKMSVQTVNTLVNGKRSMTAAVAVGLAKIFDQSPEMWMGLQTDFDLWHELRARKASA